VLLDELDSIAPSRDDGAAGGVGNRLLSTLLYELDGVTAKPGVLVVGCTNRLEAVDAYPPGPILRAHPCGAP
jgi:SpoVK/Ycf46/Vps4 family AAA+-type ATPase